MVRHAESKVDPLTVPGKWHLVEGADKGVRKLLENEDLSGASYVYSSPEIKATETAGIIADLFHLEIMTCSSLKEISFNTGFLPQPEFEKRVEDYLSGHNDTGFESFNRSADRIVSCIHSLVEVQGKNPTVVVTHGRIMTALFSCLTDKRLGYTEWSSIAMPDLSVVDLAKGIIVRGFLAGH